MYDMYRENILDHARNPRHPGILNPADVDHEEHNPLCGDRLHLTLQLDDQRRSNRNFAEELLANGGHRQPLNRASVKIVDRFVDPAAHIPETIRRTHDGLAVQIQ